MSVSPQLTVLGNQIGPVSPRTGSADGRPFASTLTIGQIIKGRVLLAYGNNRYVVAFDGRERVVDSTVPLKTGEVVQGRVLAIGERVELQRVADEHTGERAATPEGAEDAAKAKEVEPTDDLDAFFARYSMRVPSGTQELVKRIVRSGQDRDSWMLASVALAKLGLPQQERLVEVLAAALAKLPGSRPAAHLDGAAQLAIGPETASRLRDLVRQALTRPETPPELAELHDPASALPGPDGARQSDLAEGRGGYSDDKLGQWLLNAQTGGVVSHRIGTLPLIVDGRLMEVDVAMFDHGKDETGGLATRHRALVFVLNLRHLGMVKVVASVVDERIRVRVETEKAETSVLMSQHTGVLRDALSQCGWAVDEVVYENLAARTANPVVRSVMEHVVVQDSVNRLI